jgi:hypothetical protein
MTIMPSVMSIHEQLLPLKLKKNLALDLTYCDHDVMMADAVAVHVSSCRWKDLFLLLFAVVPSKSPHILQ